MNSNEHIIHCSMLNLIGLWKILIAGKQKVSTDWILTLRNTEIVLLCTIKTKHIIMVKDSLPDNIIRI